MPDTVGDELNVYKYYSIFEVLRSNREPCAKVSRYSKQVCILYALYPQQSLVKTTISRNVQRVQWAVGFH